MEKMIDLRAILQGHEGETFWSSFWGWVKFRCIPKTECDEDSESLWFEYPDGEYNGILTTDQYGRCNTLDILGKKVDGGRLIEGPAKSLPHIHPNQTQTWEEWIDEKKANLHLGPYEVCWSDCNHQVELIKWLQSRDRRYCIVIGSFIKTGDGYEFRSCGSRPFDDDENYEQIHQLIRLFYKSKHLLGDENCDFE